MFMVLDLMLGGDLRYHLDNSRGMTEEQVKLYLAEATCALKHLHQLGIVHRCVLLRS